MSTTIVDSAEAEAFAVAVAVAVEVDDSDESIVCNRIFGIVVRSSMFVSLIVSQFYAYGAIWPF